VTGPPRNIPGSEQGQVHRRAIRRAMHDLRDRHPFAPITAKAIKRLLPWLPLTDSGVRFHKRAIEREVSPPTDNWETVDTASVYSVDPTRGL
jgi:hypothetical protein